jgi:hypothetical protein
LFWLANFGLEREMRKKEGIDFGGFSIVRTPKLGNKNHWICIFGSSK